MYLTRRSELLRKRLFVPFLCAVGQFLHETRVLIVVYVSLVSTSVTHVLQKRGTLSFVFLLCVLRYPSLCAVLSSVHKSRSAVKLRWCPQNRFKSCPFVSPSGKVMHCSYHSLSSSLVLCIISWCIAPSPFGKTLPRTSLCLRTLGSANLCFLCTSRSAKYFVWSIRVLCEVGDLFDPVFRALCEVRDVSSGFSAHSVRC